MLNHPYYEDAKRTQKRDYREELPTFFGQLEIQKDALRNRRILECIR